MADYQGFYKEKKILVAGGFGFIGLNLIKGLLEAGSDVTVLDLRDQPPLSFLKDKVICKTGDIRDKEFLSPLLKNNEIFFNLAGRSGPQNSFADPIGDLETNCVGVLNILETAKEVNPEIKIVFPGSRLEFGKALHLPVSEDHPMRPTSIYGIHKLTAEKYHLAYHDNFGLNTTVLRISNLYGPHLPNKNPGYNILNYFIDLALDNKTISVFGDGLQKRDQLYIGDLVNLFMEVGSNPKSTGQVYNVGYGQAVPLITVAEKIVEIAGKGTVEKVPWDPKLQKLETGDWETDISLVGREIGWKPLVGLDEGIKKTVGAASDPYWKLT